MTGLESNLEKENLVLVNAYLTNSQVLKGFIEYLSGYFNVHFIDLPGFIQNIPPLAQISVESYAEYVREKLDTLNLGSYILGGISFGFLVASHIPKDGKCKGLIAIAPYINSRSLKLGFLKASVYSALVHLTLTFNLSARIWRSRHFHRAFHWYSDYPADRINNLLGQMDGKTFFETARIILRHRQPCPFHELPYVLIISSSDRTIKNDPLLELFPKSVECLKVLEVDTDHYPVDISPDYFRERIPEDKITEIIFFVNGKPAGN